MEEVYLSRKMDAILEKIDQSRLGSKVAIKVHFGEEGCTTYMKPDIVKSVYDSVKDGRNAALVECNVLYKGSRTTTSAHKRLAEKHGFGFAPIDILDGEMGDKEVSVEIGGTAGTAKLGNGLTEYDSMIVISHFKGHIATGFGGAIKNLGMGLGSRSGKLHMHSDVSPSIDSARCIGCMACAEACDQNAITKVSEKAQLDDTLCNGCAMCISVCPTGAVKVPWGGSTNKALQQKTADYANAAVRTIGAGNIIYINILHDITEECDCVGAAQEPMMDDIGILLSYDPVAIDKASLDLVEDASKGDFGKINPVNNISQVSYAEGIGLGSTDYRLIRDSE